MVKMETTIVHWGYTGIMENEMETTIVYWGYIGIVENKMETTTVYWGYIGVTLVFQGLGRIRLIICNSNII